MQHYMFYIPDANVSQNGFITPNEDRSQQQTGKKKGGWLVVLVNNKWCNPSCITNKVICHLDMELFIVSTCPYYYLMREFSHDIVCVVYIPPSLNADMQYDAIHMSIVRLQTQHPCSFIILSGDFNHASLSLDLQHSDSLWTVNKREQNTGSPVRKCERYLKLQSTHTTEEIKS